MRLFAALVAVAGALSCSAEVTLLELDSPPPDSAGGGGGTDTTRTDPDTTAVQRAALTVLARVAPQDSAIAASAGMPGGVLPNAKVTVQRAGASTSESAAADSGGIARFDRLLPGTYSVSVVRILTGAERAMLTGADTSIVAFGGGAQIAVAAPESQALVSARASGRGSLVISEIFPSRWLGSEPYPFGTYLEIYNNSDTIIYLDGKTVGDGPFFWFDQTASQTGIPCDSGRLFQADSTNLWAWAIWRFPGSGTQYPLRPGGTAVLATDAVDHRTVDTRWPDLSAADFEFPGSSDADNPAVPNMILAAPTVFDDLTGHGQTFEGILGSVWYVANAVDVSVLQQANPYGNRAPIRAIPADKVLDAFMSTTTRDQLSALGVVLCDPLISPVFDKLPAHYFMSGAFYSIQRHLLANHPDGRPLLLRTQATAIDFVVVPSPTPGRIP